MRDLVRLVLAVIVAALAFCGGVRCRGGLSVLMNWNGESRHWSANVDLCSTYQLPGSIAHHNPVRTPARSPLSGRGGYPLRSGMNSLALATSIPPKHHPRYTHLHLPH